MANEEITMHADEFTPCPAYPFDPNVGKYHLAMPPFIQPWEYNGWEKETMSWKKTCYISAQLHPNSVVTVKGPDATKFLAAFTTNGYDNFFVGRIKHAIVPDENGMVQEHGMIMHIAEDEYITYSLGYWLLYAYYEHEGEYNVELTDMSMDDFNFQCGGPRVLEMIEDAAQDDLHDIGFMRSGYTTIAGHKVRIDRFGMAGTLAYEIHGEMKDAVEVYNKVFECGQKYGVERLGWLSYGCNHGENGFPQEGYHFVTSSIENEGFLKWLESIGLDPEVWPRGAYYGGSSGDKDIKNRMRNPAWLGWNNCINEKTHDFPGRDIIAKELENPTYTTKTLLWNTDDLVEVFKSWFQKEDEPCRMLQFPMDDLSRTPNTTIMQDDVINENGEVVGYSSGREYSLYSRDMFSVGCIKTEYAKEGTNLFVLWGNPGERQVKIRVTVGKWPHLDMASNKEFTIDNIPRRWNKK